MNTKLHSYLKDYEVKEIKQTAKELTAKKCPFCGSEPLINVRCLLGYISAISITCSNCGSSTKTYTTGKNVLGVEYTLSECIIKALKLWEKRSNTIE